MQYSVCPDIFNEGWGTWTECLSLKAYSDLNKTVFHQFSWKNKFDAKMGEWVGWDPRVHMELSVARINKWETPSTAKQIYQKINRN